MNEEYGVRRAHVAGVTQSGPGTVEKLVPERTGAWVFGGGGECFAQSSESVTLVGVRPLILDVKTPVADQRTERLVHFALDGDHDARSVRADRKSTRLNSSHGYISYAVFCLEKIGADGGTRASRVRIRLRVQEVGRVLRVFFFCSARRPERPPRSCDLATER